MGRSTGILTWFLAFLIAVAVALPVAAQRTWIVDASNGPGADFTDLPKAVQAASAGDLILLRPHPGGAYNGWPFYIDKALSVIGLGSQPVSFYGGLSFLGTGAERMVISNIDASTGVLDFQQCPGTVVIDGLPYAGASGVGVRVAYDVGRILMTRCQSRRVRGPALLVDNTRLWLMDSRLEDVSPNILGFTGAPLYARNSEVWVVGTELIGGTTPLPTPWEEPEWGLAILPSWDGRHRSRAFVGPGCRIVGGPTYLSPVPCPAFPSTMPSVKVGYTPSDPHGPSDFVVYDPSVDFVGCRDTGGRELAHEFPAVLPGEALRGQRQDIVAWGPTQSIVSVFASFLPETEPIPLPIGDVWLDPNFVLHVGSGAVDATRRLRLQTTIPAFLTIGDVLVYQAVSLSPQVMFELSPPGIAVVR
jgi:hypothetical protein